MGMGEEHGMGGEHGVYPHRLVREQVPVHTVVFIFPT